MKKFLTIMLISLSLTGCDTEYNTYSSEIDRVDVIKMGGINDIHIRKFMYESHRYLKFNEHCVIHDPNCECFDKK